MRSVAILLTPLLVIAFACSSQISAPEPQLNLEVGFLEYSEWEARVDFESRQDGLLDIIVTTVGPGCARVGETRVERSNDLVKVTPLDLLPSTGYPCTRNMMALPHAVTVDPARLRVVVVEGRSYPGLEPSSRTFTLDDLWQ